MHADKRNLRNGCHVTFPNSHATELTHDAIQRTQGSLQCTQLRHIT